MCLGFGQDVWYCGSCKKVDSDLKLTAGSYSYWVILAKPNKPNILLNLLKFPSLKLKWKSIINPNISDTYLKKNWSQSKKSNSVPFYRMCLGCFYSSLIFKVNIVPVTWDRFVLFSVPLLWMVDSLEQRSVTNRWYNVIPSPCWWKCGDNRSVHSTVHMPKDKRSISQHCLLFKCI